MDCLLIVAEEDVWPRMLQGIRGDKARRSEGRLRARHGD
jgi:hypothetical protein